MRHTKLVVAAAVAVVLGLAGSACSSGGSDSSPKTATTETAVEGVATTGTVARPDTTDATTTSASAAPRTGQAEPVPSVGTAGSDEPALPTSGSAEAVPSVSSSGSVSPETSEPPSSTTTTAATASASTATATTTSTTTTSTTTSSTTTTTTSTTTTTTIPSADDLGGSLRPPAQTSALRPRQRNDIQLPLSASTPRDRYVPGLADINIYSQINDQGPLDLQAKLEELSIYLRYISNYQPYVGATAELRDTQGTFRETAKLLEDTLSWLGFTPQNVCGAPAGYTFTDLLQPTREWSDEFKVHRGDAIFTTDRLIELHGGERINPEENLGFYIREAVQTSYDALRLYELLDETEAPQMILCRAWKMPEGEIPEGANAYWYALLTPGIQPRESLLSQGTYHLKDMSRDGNLAYVVVCHQTLGERHILLHWREAGYRAELVAGDTNIGCQAGYESQPHFSSEPNTFKFGFGERVFSAADIQSFPRPQS